MKLSSEKEHLVVDNQSLVYYWVEKLRCKLGLTLNYLEYEDFISEGRIGLIKAAITFDKSKKVTFSTYASHCIKNKILNYYNKFKKHANQISIDEIIKENEEGDKLTYRSKSHSRSSRNC